MFIDSFQSSSSLLFALVTVSRWFGLVQQIDMNSTTQIPTPNNSYTFPSSSSQLLLHGSHLPLTANIANLPIAGPSGSHGIFTSVQPNQPQINFYYPQL